MNNTVELLYGESVEKDSAIVAAANDLAELIEWLRPFENPDIQTVRQNLTSIHTEVLCSHRNKFTEENPHVNEDSLKWIVEKTKVAAKIPGLKMPAIVCRRCETSLMRLRSWEEENWISATPLLVQLHPEVAYLARNIKIREINIAYLGKLAELLELWNE